MGIHAQASCREILHTATGPKVLDRLFRNKRNTLGAVARPTKRSVKLVSGDGSPMVLKGDEMMEREKFEKWISTEERLPELGEYGSYQKVLVFDGAWKTQYLAKTLRGTLSR